MDGVVDLPTGPPAGAGFVCTVEVVRDPHGSPRDLMIARVEVRAEQGHLAALVGRPLDDVVPGAAEKLLQRIDTATGDPVDLGAAHDLPDQFRSLTARPAGERDVWTVSLDTVPEVPPGDARVRELNHRVLNSLAMLSSIIGMEARALRDDAARAALERVRSRLVAVSNLYRILSAAGSGPLISADLYLRSVANAVAASVGFGDRFMIEVDAAPCELTTSQAASLGLIANEALTNAYKHAFTGRRDGRIRVGLSEAEGELQLTVSDDGTGMPENARSGLGTTLVEALAVDLSGEVSVESGDWGTSVRVRFPAAS